MFVLASGLSCFFGVFLLPLHCKPVLSSTTLFHKQRRRGWRLERSFSKTKVWQTCYAVLAPAAARRLRTGVQQNKETLRYVTLFRARKDVFPRWLFTCCWSLFFFSNKDATFFPLSPRFRMFRILLLLVSCFLLLILVERSGLRHVEAFQEVRREFFEVFRTEYRD